MVAKAVLTPKGYEVYWQDGGISLIDFGFALSVPAIPGRFHVPSYRIRLLTDKKFARHWNKMAAEQTRHIGKRLRELRKRKGLMQTEVASRVNMSQASISRIENGNFSDMKIVWKILDAMGYNAGDLAPDKLEKKNG